MSELSIETRIARVVAEVGGLDLERVTPDATIDGLGLDSLDQVEILMCLEDEFGIAIPDDVPAATFAQLAQAVRDQIGEVA